ncbi:hypothetical protein [Synechococcus sp. RS9902]|uniref:hypothetical protein n=1 Tax=Synechococcus sp. RS9902 TaxID=221345 RepID=UPI0016485D9E|nr:hypothetical protein [Synechococcus sp. RS9902]QNI98418.1 hypothetical protein SynRS9902_02547 [Synechococcus sp. RS9902]
MNGFIQGPGHLLQLMRAERRAPKYRRWLQHQWHRLALKWIRGGRAQLMRLALWGIPTTAWAVPIALMPDRFVVRLAVNSFDVEDPDESQLTALQETLLEWCPHSPAAVQVAVGIQQEKRETQLRQFTELARHIQAAEEILDSEES